MKRPAGIIVSITLLGVGGTACLMIAASLISVLDYLPSVSQSPSLMRIAAMLAAGLFVLGFLWQVATMVGLWLMKPWGRVSILVFSGLVVPFQFLGMLLSFFSPFSQIAPGDEQQMVSLPALIAFYGIPILVGSWWLVYFTRPAVKALFAKAPQAPAEQTRPISVITIGWAMVLTGALWPFAVYGQWPGVFLWLVFTGWTAVAVNTAWTAITVYAGVRLLRWTRFGYEVSMWLLLFATLNVLVFWLMPGGEARMRALLSPAVLPGVDVFLTGLGWWLTFAVALLGVIVPAGYLYVYREEFRQK